MRIFILGYFGNVTNQLDGQTVKTRNIYNILSNKYQVDYFDTQLIKYNKLSFFSIFKKIIMADKIIFMGGQRNLKLFFPLLFIISKILNKKLIYVVIGGWLSEFLLKRKFFSIILKNIDNILVETNFLKRELGNVGFNNIGIIPNFRIVPEVRELSFNKMASSDFKIVFMARIVEEKGIYLIFEFIERYIKNKINYKKNVIVDFYGPISDKDKKKFMILIEKYSNYVSYKGILEPDNIYKVLPQYDLLLLPTFYSGEGFPGTIIDAYLSALPVIATKWKQIPEFIDHEETGFLIEYSADMLEFYIHKLVNDNDLLIVMRKNAYIKSKFYSSEQGLKILENCLLN